MGLTMDLVEASDAAVLVSSSVLLVALYFGSLTVLPKSDTKRMQSWLITFWSCLFMTMFGAYFTVQLWVTNTAILAGGGSDFDGRFARFVCLFFLAYCLVDTLFLNLHYREENAIGLQHHSGYAALLLYLLATEQQILFAVCAIEELPTLIRAVYELKGDVLPRLTTGCFLFLFRITYHLYITYEAMASEVLNRKLFFVSIYLTLYHISFFRSWFFKRITIVRDHESQAARRASQVIADPGKAAESSPPTPRELALEVTTHCYLVAFTFLLQVLMHLFFVLEQIKAAPSPTASFSVQMGVDYVSLAVDMSLHAFFFVVVSIRMTGILLDV